MLNRRTAAALAATAAVSAGLALALRAILADEPPIEGAIVRKLDSAILGEPREYAVHLPAGYDEHSKTGYPVLYALDGTSQSGHTAESAAILARIGAIPEVIVIGVPSPNGETRNRDYTPPDMRLDTDVAEGPRGAADRFLLFLEGELIPEIERQYRASRPRLLSGWSRGGLFAVYSALRAPALFDGRLAHSPALWREDDRIVGQLRTALAAGSWNPGFLYLSLGDRENEKKMTTSFRRAVDVVLGARRAGLRFRADLSAGGTHEGNPRLSSPVGLCEFFSAGPRTYPCAARGVSGDPGT